MVDTLECARLTKASFDFAQDFFPNFFFTTSTSCIASGVSFNAKMPVKKIKVNTVLLKIMPVQLSKF